MSAILRHHSLDCAAERRHKYRRPHIQRESGKLAITTPEVAARLLDEGVPADDLRVVAAEIERCIRVINDDGDDVLYIRLHSWTAELIRRFGDKLVTLTMTTRGNV